MRFTARYPMDRRLWYPKGSVDMKALHLLYSFMVYLLVLVLANIIINDMIAYSEFYMMCTSYLSITDHLVALS